MDDSPRTLEQVAQEERLYEEYLAARADQAEEVARAAAEGAAKEPSDCVKTVEAERAKGAAEAATAELAMQRVRVMKIQRAAEIEANVTTRPRPATRPAKPGRHARGAAPNLKRKATLPHMAASPRAPQTKLADRARAPRAVQVANAAATTAATPRANGWRPKRHKRSKRHTQTTQASQAAKPKRARAAPRATSGSPRQSKKASKLFQATQATKAAKAVNATTVREFIECLWCTATIPATAKRCRCGWLVPAVGAEIPLLALGATERAALVDGLELGRPPKQR